MGRYRPAGNKGSARVSSDGKPQCFPHPQATDPDVGDEGRLDYGLSADSPYFDVDPSSGLVYVVSAAGLAGQTAAVEVKATDPRGLSASARVEVSGEDRK